MNKHKIRRIYLLGGLAVVLVMVVYLNRSYAYFYNKIGEEDLKSPAQASAYLIANNMSAQETNKTSLVYSALGDSLSAGVGAENYEESFPYLLAQYLAGNDYQVTLNVRAIPGAKTSDLLNGLLDETIKDNPDVVTLFIGVNDLHNNISPAEFANNYEQILKRLSAETKAKIYVINLPLIGADNLLLPPHNYLIAARTREFNQIIKKLAETSQVKYLDLYTSTHSLFKQPGDHYASDLFHPSALGYKIWADLIYADFNQ